MILPFQHGGHTKCHKISPLNAGCKIIFMCANSLFRGSIGLCLQVAFATKRPLRRRAYAEATISGLDKLSRRFSKGERELSKGVVERRTSTESALKIGQNHKLPFVSRSSGRRLQLPAVV